MIHEEICTYEVAKLAKEKGFPLRKVIKQDGRAFFYELPQSHPDWANCDAWYIPTQSLLQRWLREEKNIVVVVDWFSIERKYYWSVFDTTKDDMFASFIPPAKSMSRYDTWEQALECGLKYALKKLE